MKNIHLNLYVCSPIQTSLNFEANQATCLASLVEKETTGQSPKIPLM